MTGEIARIFDDALTCLASEHPPAYAAMQTALGARRFDLEIDGEELMIDLGTPADATVISIRTDVGTLSDLIDGNCSTLDAILEQRLDVVADVDDLIAAGRAMTYFMQGALRCISMRSLHMRLVELRRGVRDD